MRRFVRWFSAVCLAFAGVTILPAPVPASAAILPVSCGANCELQALDAICWEWPETYCRIPITVKGTVPSGGVAVVYQTRDGRAMAPRDYTAVERGVIVLPEGARESALTVWVVADGVTEASEGFSVIFTTPVNEVPGVAQVTIMDGSIKYRA